LLYNDDNPALVKNEKVKYYTLTSQVLTKIIFYNLLLKSGKYSYVRGYTPLLIYCLLRDIRVNILKLIIDFILLKHLLIPSRNLPYAMIITHLFKYFKIDVSGETAFALVIDIDRTLLIGCK